ncbi:putative multidrug export ATP-binding/permease protein YgaD [Paenibacillus sp. J31TS4]|uniref:ABC transporter ATP-binding protein n=1 Tax=Paenibacillus sp. J31TS4 TaxID=2807195 RepID=UPI001B1400E3|nr:ABC transporter ATP-binding protein [Paenibacillus sp. J31TS4]GIP37366.1 putative multidrug export ATP-binding/permease protein YgaD [Paenibacillus sp. J31TS4]
MELFKRFRPYAQRQIGLYLLGFIGSLFRFLIPLSVPLIMKYLFDHLLPDKTMAYGEKLNQLLLLAAGVLAVFFLIRGPMEYVRQWFLHKANNNIIRDLRTDTFQKVHKLDADYLADHKSGEIGTRFFDDIEKIRGYMTAMFSNVWIELTVLLFVVGIMLSLHAPLTLMAVLLVGLQFALAHFFSKRLKQTTRQLMKYRSVLSGFVFEKIQGAFLSRLFAAERKDKEELGKHLVRFEHLTDRQARVNAMSLAAVNVLADATPFLVVLAGSLLVLDGRLTLGALIAFFAYVDRMRAPVSALVQAFPAIAEGGVAMKRIFDFLDTPSSVQEREQPRELGEFRDAIAFRNVSFSYRKDRPLIRNLSFTLQKGRTYAFVGESGGGKSTILHLLTRLYDVEDGEVLIDGVNVKELSFASLRDHIGIVTQDSFLYSSSVMDNIRIGRLDAADSEVMRAARKAHAHSFISGLPEGYETEVGERGIKLSGGQRQRIALARVFLKNPSILLLDEATSALDNESEKLVQQSVMEAGREKTVILVAHRLSTVIHADCIFVMKQGGIAESGSHRELMEWGGYYKSLFTEQSRAELAKQRIAPSRPSGQQADTAVVL